MQIIYFIVIIDKYLDFALTINFIDVKSESEQTKTNRLHFTTI